MKTLDQIEPRTPLKSADFPLTITASGSYYLTENVKLTADSSTGITINTSNVTIDLNGFSLIGPAALSITGDGIVCISDAAANITISNGGLQFWSADGCDLSKAQSSKVTNVVSYGNGGVGILVGTDGIVSNCAVQYNIRSGIKTSDFCVIDHCTSQFNANYSAYGIECGQSCIVSNCTAHANLSSGGIYVGFGGSIIGCTAYNNQGGFITSDYCFVSNCVGFQNYYQGFLLGEGSAISDCAAGENQHDGFSLIGSGIATNCVSRSNGGTGFYLNGASAAINCSASSNADDGFLVGNDCTLNGNKSYSNSFLGFEIGGTGNTVVGNAAGANSTGFGFFSQNNFIAKNVAHGNIDAAFSFSGNQTAGTVYHGAGTIPNDPWANFEY